MQATHEGKNVILKIPFLLFADETIEDDDRTLAPIVHEIMSERGEPQVMGF